jgi:AraC-like DNA-binding protein
MLIFFMASLPHLFSPWLHKVEIANKIVGDIYFLRSYNSTFLTELFNSNVVYLSRPVLVLCYAAWSLNLFLGFLREKGEAKILNNQHLMTKWLSGLFAFLTIWFVGHTLQIIDLNISGTVNVFFSLNILQIISGAGLIGLLVLPFFFPAVLYGMPGAVNQTRPSPLEDKSIKVETVETDGLQVLVRKSENRYGADYLLLIHQKVDSCMKDTQPYLRSDCNLGYLSTLIDVPFHHLSHYFREEKKQAFTDYRNGLRIAHAKSLILEGRANDLTLEAIGMLSGFTNRNTFFISFKKVEGVSPKEFLALHTQETTNR